jgi:hypothetical protein
LSFEGACVRRPVKSAPLRPLSADDSDELPKHINALSTGIHELHELPPRRRDPPRSLFTYKHARYQTVTR